MKVKSLLTVACLASAMVASASIPLKFKNANNQKEGSYFDYPIVEGTNETTYGEPLFNEDGSIDLTSTPAAENGIWWRTWALTEACGPEYNVFAFEYKSNRVVTNIVLFPQEGNGNFAEILSGNVYSVSDEWQTLYFPLQRGAEWGQWGNPEGEEFKKGKNYLWVSTNDANGKLAGWKVSIKNVRMMTMAEAVAECKPVEAHGDYAEVLLAATGLVTDNDADMDADVISSNGVNPILATGSILKPLPAGYTTFCFDYKLAGTSFNPTVYMVDMAGKDVPGALATVPNTAGFEAVEDDPYTEEWKTFTIDMSAMISQYKFGQYFGCNHNIWMQLCAPADPATPLWGEDGMMWIKNPRWINPNEKEESGVAEIGVAERPADNRVFNMMGVEVKGELAPGLYIRDGKKFIVK